MRLALTPIVVMMLIGCSSPIVSTPVTATPVTATPVAPTPVKVGDSPEERTRRLETVRELEEQDLTVLENKNRTIKIRGMQAWSGVNNTGDLDYESCDIDRQCLSLKGGIIGSRDGTIAMGWQNGDYHYSLVAPITEAPPSKTDTGYILTVRKGDRVILTEGGFTQKSPISMP
jgi:hypothetical protein